MRPARWLPLAALITIASVAPSAGAHESTTGWVLGNPRGGKVVSGKGYNLLNVYNKTYLDVRGGTSPELDAAASAPENVEIATGKPGEVRCGDAFTLRARGRTLAYDPKTQRVVVAGEGEASEWRFLGCKKGEPVALGAPLALVNVRRQDSWVGCRRLGTPTYCWDDKQLMGIATD